MLNPFTADAEDIAQSAADAAWFTGWITLAGVLVAVGAISLTVVQVVKAARSVRDAARADKISSLAKARPYVSIEIVTGIGGSSSFDMVVANRGRSTAESIRITPQSGKYDEIGLTPALAQALQRMFEAGFNLGPGERRRFFWRLDPVDADLPREAQPSSVRDELGVTYGWTPENEDPIEFDERAHFDLTDFVVVIPSPQTGARSSGGTDRMHTDLSDIRLAINALSEHVAELRR